MGYVTSGTMVPYYPSMVQAQAPDSGEKHAMRSIGLAYLDSDVLPGDEVSVDVRGRRLPAVVTARHLRSNVPPYAQPVLP